MKIATYIKSIPHSVEFVQATDKSTGEPIPGKSFPRSRDFRTVGWINDGLRPIPNGYGAVIYNEAQEGRILKPVGRDPIRVTTQRVNTIHKYEKNRGNIVPNFYQSLFVHNPDLVDHYAKDVNDIKVLDLDIETVTTGIFPDPYDNDNRYPVCMLGYSINGKDVEIGDFELDSYLDHQPAPDRRLLDAFADILIAEDPDIICTFNGYDFDLPFMSVRCLMIDKDDGHPFYQGPLWQKFALALCRAKPNNDNERTAFLHHMRNNLFYPTYRGMEPPKERQTTDLLGRLHYDILRVDAEGDQQLTGKVKNKKMKTLLKHFKFKGLVEIGADIRNTVHMMQHEYDRFRSYLVSDVQGTAFLRERYQGINYKFCEMLNLPLSMVLERGRGTLPNVFSLKAELENNTWPMEGSDHWKRHRHLFALNRTYQGAIVGVMKNNKILPKKVPAHIYMRESWKLDFACVDDQTQALTATGWKFHHELTENDKIMTWEPVEDRLEFQEAKINRYDVIDHPMIAVENTYTDLLMTENHRQYYYNIRKDRERIRVEEASKLPTYIEIPVSSSYEPDRVYTSSYDRFIPLISWILTEGHINDSNILITQRETVNKEYCDLIRQRLIDANVAFTENRGSDERDIIFRIRKQDADKIKEFMQNRYRRIPSIIFQKDLETRRQFILDMIRGDGHIYERADNETYVFVNKEFDLISDLQILCHISNMRTVISSEYTDERNGCKWFYLHITDKKTASISCNEERFDKEHLYVKKSYTGTVWCPTVQNKAWMARRNGKVFITGNSMYVSCIIEFNLGPDSVRIMYDYEDSTDVINPENPHKEFGKPTLRRIIPDGWMGPNGISCMHCNAPSPEMWEAYKIYLKEVDPGLHDDLFQTRFVQVKDDVGLDYLDVYFPDSKLNAQVHVRINSHKESYFRTKVIDLQNQRTEIKKLMKEAKDDAEKLTLNSTQGVLKVLGNSVYGLSGATHSSLDFAMGVTITGLCRWCTETVIAFINSKWPNSIKEIDTDGLIVSADVPEDEVNAHLHAALTAATGSTTHYMRLEKEVFGRAYIYRMKNYIFIEDGDIKMHGATMVSSAHCKVYDECVKEMAKFVLSDDFMDSEELDKVSRTSERYLKYEDIRQKLVTKYITNIHELPVSSFVQMMTLKHDPDYYIGMEMNNLQEKVVRRALELNMQVVRGSSVQYISSNIKEYDIFIEGNHKHNEELKVFYEKYASMNSTIFERFNISTSIDRMNFKVEDINNVLEFLKSN